MFALNRLRSISQGLCGAGAIALLAAAASAGSAHANRLPAARASIYAYDGVVYDRLLSARGRPRALDRRVTASLGTPYAIVDLEQIYNKGDKPSDALTGFPTAVNNSGKIAYYDDCECFYGVYSPYNEGLIIDAAAATLVGLANFSGPSTLAYTIPYAINDAGYSGGQYAYEIPGLRTGNMVWNPQGGYIDSASISAASSSPSTTRKFRSDRMSPPPGRLPLRISTRHKRRTARCAACCSRPRRTPPGSERRPA